MTYKPSRAMLAIGVTLFAIMVSPSAFAGIPTDTTFTYQGQLKQNGAPTNNTCDFKFRIWDAEVGGLQKGLTVNASAILVENGLFSYELDFGAAVFDGSVRWLEVDVRCPAVLGSFATLSPRQSLTATPYAMQTRGLFVDDASNVGINTTNPLHPLHVEGDALGVVYGLHTNPATEGAGGWFETVSDSGAGVAGFATGVKGRGVGVWGQSESPSGIGVTGYATSSSGSTKAIWGICESNEGHAGYFEGRTYFGDNVGIREKNPLAKLHIGGTPGLDGLMFPDGTLQTTAAIGGGGTGSLWSESADVFSSDIFYSEGNVGVGVESNGSKLHVRTTLSDAIFAETSDPSGTAVKGIATATTDGPAWGGYFTSASPLGRGVFAHALATSGNTIGGFFMTGSSAGKGVFAQAYSQSGVNYGVFSETFSPDGYAGYFKGGRNYFEGNVGIGVSNPTTTLHLGGSPGVDGIIFPDGSLQTTAVIAGGGDGHSLDASDGSPVDALFIDGNGRVRIDASLGVGTTPNAAVMLDIDGDTIFGLRSTTSLVSGLAMAGYSAATSGFGVGVFGETLAADGIGVRGNHISATGTAAGVHGTTTSAVNYCAGVRGEATSTSDFGITTGVTGISRAGFGMGVYGKAVHTGGGLPTFGGYFESMSSRGIGVQGVNSSPDGYGGYFVGRGYFSGNVGIGTSTPGVKLDVVGWIRTEVIEITGGSDLSEQFDVNAENSTVQPGMVVSIDAKNPGKLAVSVDAYDRKVAGVISGAGGVKPGMIMGQRGTIADGKHPVALTGRVWTLCDTSNGPITPGDMLTTSGTAGHAMKVTDFNKAQGASIGKAMTALDSGTGLVLVLVSLQ